MIRCAGCDKFEVAWRFVVPYNLGRDHGARSGWMPLDRLGSNHAARRLAGADAVFSARMNSRSGTKRISLAAVFAALVLSAARADALPSFGMFTSYQSARQNLLRQGWLPWRLPNASSCSPQDDRCHGRPEMLSCDTGGAATCVFTWKKASSVIEVTTRGKGASPGVTGVKCQSGCGSP